MRSEHVERRLGQQLPLAERIKHAYQQLISVGLGNISRHRIEARLQALREDWESFHVNHSAIVMCIGKVEVSERMVLEQHDYFMSTVYDKTYQIYLDNVEKMSILLDTCEIASTSSTLQPTSIVTRIESRLPRIDIPKYDGTFNNWLSFRDLFSSIVISNESISLVEKFQYLKTSLIGPASQFIKNISLTSDNFQKAWESLTSFYENDRLLVQAAVTSLFSIKAMTKESSVELEQLYSSTLQAVRTLETLNRPVHSWDDILVHLTVNRLDVHLVRSWENYLGASKKPPSWIQLEDFLKTKMVSLQSFEKIPKKSATNQSKQPHFKSHHSTNHEDNETALSFNQAKCPCCSRQHLLLKCSQFLSKTTTQRLDFIKAKKLCYNCLRDHFSSNCKSLHRCMKCGRKHHTLLHQHQHSNRSATPVKRSTTTHPITESKQVNHLHRPLTVQSIVFLATARVRIIHENGTCLEVRALFDQGSEISLVSEHVVQHLKLHRRSSSIPIVGIGAKKTCSTRGVVSLKIKPHFESSITVSCQAYILPKLTSTIPSGECYIPQWPHLKNLSLADPYYNTPKPIDLIIGADIYGQLLEGSVIKGPDNSPTAHLTKFGWIISGPTSTNSYQQEVMSNHCAVDEELYTLLEKFWQQEKITSLNNKLLSPKDQECENHFMATHSRDESGRYTVRLPFKTPINQIGDSRRSAMRMLNHLQTKLSSDPEFFESYSSFLKEYKTLHHMTEISVDEPEPNFAFYLPHHGVKRESSTTTKLRVVFNGSCHVTEGIPLNEALHAGPKLQINLFDVLIWLRQFKYVFTADVEKMYRQIQLHKDDRQFQRIFWKENDKIVKYELATVTYGLVCAPYLALRAVLQLIKDEGQNFPLAAEILLKGRYVDDVFGGADTIEEAQLKAQQTYDLSMAGCFPLRKWVSNEPKILDLIASNYRVNLQSIPIEEQNVHALGLSWNPALDIFQFKLTESSMLKVTKRTVLSKIAQFFDPLGLLSPLFIKPKIFMQELWIIKTGWDEPLNGPQVKSWQTLIKSLDGLDDIEIPRWSGMTSRSQIEIHGFSDASQLAMAAAVYIRTYDSHGTRVTLICSKTKVAPIKRMTIPRLELTAAVLLAKLVTYCQKVLNLNQVPCYLWTDSAIVHVWLNNHPSRWKEFIHNRVCLIQDLIPHAIWKFVPGTTNPADCATRGVTAKELETHTLWWKGPSWLINDPSNWPAPPIANNITNDLEERSKRLPKIANVCIKDQIWDLQDRFSTLSKLLRVTATCKRAIKCFKSQSKPLTSHPISPAEINEARIFWTKLIQRQTFNKEIAALQQKQEIPSSSSLIRLTPFLDYQGLLRVGGRLKHSSLPTDTKHPYILPKDSHLSLLLIDEAHKRTFHGSTQDTLSYIRNQYWILGGRAPVRSFILKCVKCSRYRRIQANQLMGQLPYSRVNPSRAFLHTGVDYAGPYEIKTWRGRNPKTYKAWIALFICLATSAIHVELVTDYSSEAFIAAYRRFVSRRGICSALYSDCGTNFIGANKQLKEFFAKNSQQLGNIVSSVANDGTTWHFNPPAAPHFGGKWEAAVKSMKHHLRRVADLARFTYEEFTTLLIQIEAILNSRPIMPLTNDPDDLDVLTPGHFLVGHSLTIVPEPNLEILKASSLSRWQRISQLTQSFWSRWSREYLQRFHAIYKWNKLSPQLSPGDIVLIMDERYPPGKWPLGRILQTHPGSDGLIRVVTIKTSSATLTRPVTKLCPLLSPSTSEVSSLASTKAGGNV